MVRWRVAMDITFPRETNCRESTKYRKAAPLKDE